MDSVRVLLGALPAPLRSAVDEVARRHPDIEVVGVALQPSKLLRAVGTLRADVVIVAAVGGQPPGVASHLLDQYPRTCVLALSPDAGSALLCSLRLHTEQVATASPVALARAIRGAEPDDPSAVGAPGSERR